MIKRFDTEACEQGCISEREPWKGKRRGASGPPPATLSQTRLAKVRACTFLEGALLACSALAREADGSLTGASIVAGGCVGVIEVGLVTVAARLGHSRAEVLLWIGNVRVSQKRVRVAAWLLCFVFLLALLSPLVFAVWHIRLDVTASGSGRRFLYLMFFLAGVGAAVGARFLANVGDRLNRALLGRYAPQSVNLQLFVWRAVGTVWAIAGLYLLVRPDPAGG